MKRCVAFLAAMLISASAYAVQTLTLKDVPPPQPLNWCKHADGTVDAQVAPCGPDMVAVSSWVETGPDGKPRHLPLGWTPASAPDPAKATEAANKNKSRMLSNMGSAFKHYGMIFGIALVVGLLAKMLGKSFWLWAVLGLGVRYLLVALNVLGS